jgi:hypothetical protein
VSPSEDDVAAVSAQLGRPARGICSIAHRCECGLPDVVETEPRLPDGTPFPTLFYVTCPRLASAIGRLEADGTMREMTDRLAADPSLAAAYEKAHESYLARREAIEDVREIKGISAGGMPNRVKCLHVLVGHSLAEGAGVNPLGDEALVALPAWGRRGPCVGADQLAADGSGADGSGADESGADESGADESGADESGADE